MANELRIYRFAAALWEADSPSQSEAARRLMADIQSLHADWRTPVDRPGIRVMHTRTGQGRWHACSLGDDHGVVLGTLFRRAPGSEGDSPITTLQPLESRRILESNGRYLMEGFWGRYIAFLIDGQGRRRFVLRDPAGQLACHHVQIGDVHVYISDPSLLARCRNFAPAFDPKFLVANIMVPELAIERSGLVGVNEVFPGGCHEIARNGISKCLAWNPAHIARERPIEDFEEARTVMRETVQCCVSAWSSCYGKVVHNLSGGLDSSIVLSCLTRARNPVDVLCINYRTADAEGDERDFARLAARRSGCELFEFAMAGVKSLEQVLSAHPLTAVPSGSIFGLPTKARERAIALEHGAHVFTSGEGGDHLFYEMSTPAVAADVARMNGLGAGTLKVVRDTAVQTGQSVWTVFGFALGHGLLRRRWMPAPGYDANAFPYLAADIRHSIGRTFVRHPWEREAAAVPPGKAYQIHLLTRVLRRRDVSPRSEVADIVHPLLSQPIMELALRIPSYVLTHGGESRALARAAFEGLVPTEILSRNSKGGTTGHFVRLVLGNLEGVREFLCGGLLVEEGIAERVSLERYLHAERLNGAGNISAVLKLLSTEGWLRSWRRVRRKAAA